MLISEMYNIYKGHADNDLKDEEYPFDVGYNPYEVDDRTVVCSKKTKTQTPKESFTPAMECYQGRCGVCCCGQKQEEGGKEEGYTGVGSHNDLQRHYCQLL